MKPILFSVICIPLLLIGCMNQNAGRMSQEDRTLRNGELLSAIERCNLSDAKEALSLCADINARNVDGMPVLIWAAQQRQWEIVKFLLENGANANAKDNDGQTAMIWAVGNGNIEIVKFLFRKGATVNTKEISKGVLFAAMYERHTEILKLLIDKGADVNVKIPLMDKEWTPLMIAKEAKYTDAIQLLEKAGAKE
jgi:ankyrin repeat protein